MPHCVLHCFNRLFMSSLWVLANVFVKTACIESLYVCTEQSLPVFLLLMNSFLVVMLVRSHCGVSWTHRKKKNKKKKQTRFRSQFLNQNVSGPQQHNSPCQKGSAAWALTTELVRLICSTVTDRAIKNKTVDFYSVWQGRRWQNVISCWLRKGRKFLVSVLKWTFLKFK